MENTIAKQPISATKEDTKTSEITNALDYYDYNLDLLSSVIDRLWDKLLLVRNKTEVCSDTQEEKLRETLCPLASELKDKNERLWALSLQLEDILSEIKL